MSVHTHTDPLLEHAPAMAQAYRAMNKAIFSPEATVPLKYRELTAVAVAVTTQCEGCIRGHVTAAVAAGATDVEIAETIHVAIALRAGGGAVHGRKALAIAAKARQGE